MLLDTYTKAAGPSPVAPLAAVKFAVTEPAALNVIVQVAVPLQSPFQDVNASLLPGFSLSVTWVFSGNAAEHVAGQLVPGGVLVTVPVPVPFPLTVSSTPGLNSALTVAAADMVRLQAPV